MVKEKYPRTKRQVQGMRLEEGFYNKKEGNQKAEKDVQEREKRKNIALGPSIAVSKDFKLRRVPHRNPNPILRSHR